jgi:hypothetical protein
VSSADLSEVDVTEGGRKQGWFRIPTCCLVLVMLAALIAAGVIILTVGGRMRLRAALDDIRAHGEPVTATDLYAPDVPDAANAYVYYKNAATLLGRQPDDVSQALNRMPGSPPAQWSRADLTLIRRYVTQHAASIRLARQGAHLAGYKTEVKWEQHAAALFPHLSKSRDLARLLAAKADLDLADGHPDEAIDTCGDALRIASHTGSEPTLIALLVEIACRAIALGALEQVAAEAHTPDQLERVLHVLDEARHQPHATGAMLGERAMSVGIYEDVAHRKLNLAGLFGISSGVAASLAKLPYPRCLLFYDEAAYLSIMKDYVEVSGQPYYRVQRRIAAIDQRAQNLPRTVPVARILMPVYSRAFAHEATSRARFDVLRVGVAVKLYRLRHGRYPGTLADLAPGILPRIPIDEFTGKPLIYKVRGRGFVVYSVGANTVDEGGVKNKNPLIGDIVHEEK